MPRLLVSGLHDALARRRQQMKSYGTLQLTVELDAEIRTYYLATAKLNFNGIAWTPALRESGEVDANLFTDASEATIEIQNVDTLFGIEFVGIEEFLSGAEAVVGEYWKDREREAEWHEELLTGFVTGLDPNQQNVQLRVVPDTYSGVSVGPLRHATRLCTFPYKSDECGRPKTDPFTFCDYTLNGADGCDGRWGATQKLIHHGGTPYRDNQVVQKII